MNIEDSKTKFGMPEDRFPRGGDGGDGGDGDSGVNEFPVGAFPEAISGFIREASESLVCPPELVGVPLLVMCASAIGNSRVIRAKTDWEESATIYAASIALPGSKKTPAANKANRPLLKEQAGLAKDYRETRKKYEKDLREYKKDGEGEPPTEPIMGSTFVDDTTVEALMLVLRDNPRGVMVNVDELGGWVRSMDQYKSGKGSDRQKWLSMWSNNPIKVDRKKQETVALDRPFVSIYGGIQPGILPEIADGREDGMLDRFLLSYPEPVGNRWSDAEISEDSKQALTHLYDKLRGLHMDLDDYGDPTPKPVHFDADAKQMFIRIVNEHNGEAERPGFPNRLRGPWAKMEAYILRITLVLSLVRSVSEGAPERIELTDVLAAEVLLGYFKSHARKVYNVLYEADQKDQFAVDLVRFVEEMGGSFLDTPATVLRVIRSEHKPSRPEDITKWSKEIAKRVPGLDIEQSNIGRGNNKRRLLKLSLENTVPTVPAVPTAAEPLTQEEIKEGWSVTMSAWANVVVKGEPPVPGKVFKDRYANGDEGEKETVIETATRLVLYGLDRPTQDWERHAPEVRAYVEDEQREREERMERLTEEVLF